ncbi:MAG: hypothetical protein QOC57_1970 [Ilumatobacteraceae bacterium]
MTLVGPFRRAIWPQIGRNVANRCEPLRTAANRGVRNLTQLIGEQVAVQTSVSVAARCPSMACTTRSPHPHSQYARRSLARVISGA